MPTPNFEYMKPLASSWLAKMAAAKRHKKTAFQDVADQCMYFYSGAVDFMYSQKYQQKYLRGTISPKFQICLQKAFEFVAIIGPLIYNRSPHRNCTPPRPSQFTILDFGDPNDPTVQQMYQQAMMQEQMRGAVSETRCGNIERYLNYTSREQPGGGLKKHGQLAVNEALVKGRGTLWPHVWSRPGSQRSLTGSEYETVDRLLIDPDAESAEFGSAYWIAREHLDPHWVPERRFGLPFGSLRNKDSGLQSSDAQASTARRKNRNLDKQGGRSYDLCHWYEIWSIGGVGGRLSGTTTAMRQAFDDVVGDYAYICVCDGYDAPLNAQRDKVTEASDDDVVEMFDWPISTWADNRWPVAMLDFYTQPNKAWPLAPIAPGLGELTAVNIIVSRLVEQVWWNTQQLIAVLKSAQADVDAQLRKQGGRVVIGLPDIHSDINNVVSFLDKQDTKVEAWKIIEMLFTLFDKRVGLAEMLYGMSGGAADRTATTTRTKREKLSVRPDYMATMVEDWLGEVSTLEKITAYFGGIDGNDVQPILGPVGAALWEEHFTNADPDVILGETDCTIAVGSAKKPNKERDLGVIEQLYGPMSQEFSKHADVTGDTSFINELNKRLTDAIDADPDGLMMSPRFPPPPPPGQEDPEVVAKQTKLDIDVAEHAEDLEYTEAKHEMELDQDQEAHDLDMQQKRQMLALAQRAQTQRPTND